MAKAPVVNKVLTERGLHLEKAHQAQQNSNVRTGQPVAITDDIRVEIGQQCPVCNKRVRGPNHIEGDHHKGTVPKRSHR